MALFGDGTWEAWCVHCGFQPTTIKPTKMFVPGLPSESGMIERCPECGCKDFYSDNELKLLELGED